MKLNLKSLGLQIAVVCLFIIAPLIYFNPVLKGDVIFQSDIAQYNSMAKERNDYLKETGEESYWTDSAFGGMPTYQLGANYPNNYIKELDKVLRFLPRPADYVFLYLIGFYVLMLVLKVDYRLAILGSVAFGFSTYLIIILGVGHNAKAHAIAYFPMVIAGILLVFKKNYLWGGILAAIAMALEICANHFQMTYYLLLLVLVFGIVYLVYAIKEKELAHYFKSIGVLVVAVIIAVLTNATNLMATQEYAAWSTRGKSDLTFKPDGTKKESNSTLDKSYITDYSYGITESLDLFVPRLFGGSNAENLGEDSKTYEYLVKQGYSGSEVLGLTSSLPTYWGEQPGTSGAAYIGAVVIFFFILSLFLVEGKFKWWLIAGSIMSLVLSWGKNFSFITDLMIDYFPLYDKFRAVSSIQVILELCVPLLGVYGLTKFFNTEVQSEKKLKAVKWTGIILGSIIVLLFLGKSSFDFVGVRDEMYRKYYGNEVLQMIVEDRKSIYNQDLFRSFILIAISFGVLWMYLKNTLKKPIVLATLIVLVAFDLIGVDKRYVNDESFVDSKRMDQPVQLTQADAQILKDTTHFRVYDVDEGLNGASASYFHSSIGGYHAAKPRRLQELFEYQLAKNNVEIINMLNVKYIIGANEKGQKQISINPNANGNAWFVSSVKKVNSEDEAMKAIDSLKTNSEAIISASTAQKSGELVNEYTVDSTSAIKLTNYKPNRLTYISDNAHNGLAVFSEMYYPQGWKATIDGKEAIQYRADYALRALVIPAGKHKVEFSFEPEVVKTGSTISLFGNILLGLLIVGGIVFQFKKQKE